MNKKALKDKEKNKIKNSVTRETDLQENVKQAN